MVSHKWVFTGGAPTLTARRSSPTDDSGNCKIGVCAHELGTCCLGWPDLYDTDGSSEGVGDCADGRGS